MSAYWGPRLWYLLHTYSVKIELTTDNRNLWAQFLKVSLAVMNCPKCQSHFSKELMKHNMKTISRNDFEEWFYNLHNAINEENGKLRFSEEEWSAVKQTPVDKEKIVTVIHELSAHFLKNEQMTHLNAGSGRIWRGLATRFLIQL